MVSLGSLAVSNRIVCYLSPSPYPIPISAPAPLELRRIFSSRVGRLVGVWMVFLVVGGLAEVGLDSGDGRRALNERGHFRADQEDHHGVIDPEDEEDQVADSAVEGAVGFQQVGGEQLFGDFPEDAGREAADKGGFPADVGAGQELVDVGIETRRSPEPR